MENYLHQTVLKLKQPSSEKKVAILREMAYAMFSAGFEVYDIHMTDLIEEGKPSKNLNLLRQWVVFQIQMCWALLKVGQVLSYIILGPKKAWMIFLQKETPYHWVFVMAVNCSLNWE